MITLGLPQTKKGGVPALLTCTVSDLEFRTAWSPKQTHCHVFMQKSQIWCKKKQKKTIHTSYPFLAYLSGPLHSLRPEWFHSCLILEKNWMDCLCMSVN